MADEDKNPDIDYENDPFAKAIEEAESSQTPDEGAAAPEKPEDSAQKPANIDPTQDPDSTDEAFQDEWDNATSGSQDEPEEQPKEEVKEEEDSGVQPEPNSVDEDDEFDLNKLLDDPEEDTTEEGTEETEEESEEPEDAEDLKNPHDSAKFKERLDRALDRGKKQGRKEAESELQEKVKQLEEQLQSTESELQEKEEQPELSEEERKELQMLRRRLSAESDPEVKEKFDDRIKANESSIHEILKTHFPEEEDQKILEKSGVYEDFEKFARSNPKGYRDLIKQIEEESPYDAELISKAAAESSTIKRQKQSYIEEVSQNAQEYFAQKEAEAQKAQAEAQKAAKEREQLVTKYYEDLTQNPKSYLRKKELPQGVTEKQKRFIEKRNQVIEKSQKLFQRAAKPSNYSELLDVAYAASSVPVLKDTIRALNAQLKEKETELQKRRDVAKTGRSKSHSASNTSPNVSKDKYADMDLDEAIAMKEREAMGR